MTMTPETDAIALLQDKINTTYIRGQARLAAALGKHPNTIKRWHAMGEAPPHKRVGHEYLYSITEVMTWLDDQNAAMENALHLPQKKTATR